LFEAVAGFRPDPEQPGFAHVVFEPLIIPALSPVKAHHDSRAGRIEAGWVLEDDRVTYDISVPNGATGTLMLSPDYQDAALDGTPLARADGNEKARSLLAPGKHRITFRISR